MNKKNIKIIPAEITHVKELATLHIRAWQEAYKNIVPQEIMSSLSIEGRTKAFTEAIHGKSKNTYSCMLNNVVIGFVTLGNCRDSDINNAGEIWGIYLDPKFWRKGIGTELANWAIDYLKQSGFNKIILWVFKDNLPSRKFYESIEYVVGSLLKTISEEMRKNQIKLKIQHSIWISIYKLLTPKFYCLFYIEIISK